MNFHLTETTTENFETNGIFCSKDLTSDGFKSKKNWFLENQKNGLRIVVARDENDKTVGFIEFINAEHAWRPLVAPDYLFIHCMFTYPNKVRHAGLGKKLIDFVKQTASTEDKAGIAVMTSKGTWITTKEIFLKNSFDEIEDKGRFELMAWKNRITAVDPVLIDWTKNLIGLKGWHLIYADQCPWHEKAVRVMQETARSINIDLNVKKLNSPSEIRSAPSGFGVFSLVNDERLLEDHYISERRFRTILEKEEGILS